MKLKVLSIGANFRQPHDLRFAQNDAIAVYEAFNRQKLYESIESVVLASGEKSSLVQNNIVAQSSNCDTSDCLIFFFAGHGLIEANANGEDQLYLVCNDTDLKDPENSAVPLDKVLKAHDESKANVAVTMLDCCFSGYGGRSILGPKTLRKLQTGRSVSIKVPVAKAFGRVVVAASGRNETAGECSIRKHGLFTAALLEALSANGARSVSLPLLYDELCYKIAGMTDGKQCPSMYGGMQRIHLPATGPFQ